MPRPISRRALLDLGLVFLAAAVRLGNLTWRSLDGDEGASLYFSSWPWEQIFGRFIDMSVERHPLLYYSLLKGWRLAAGETDLALRLPSALAGILTVVILSRLARQQLGGRAGALTALLAGLSPLLIYQSQDTRMYAAGLLFSATAAWMLLLAVRRPPERAWAPLAVFVVAAPLAGYSHLSAGLFLPAFGLIALLELRRTGRVHWPALGAITLAGLSYLPYLWLIFQGGGGAVAAFTAEQWLTTLQSAALTLLAPGTPAAASASGRWLMTGVAALLVVAGAWRAGRTAGPALAAWFLVGFGLNAYILLRIEFFQAKTLAFSALPFWILAAGACFGRARRPGWLSALAAAALVTSQFWALSFLWRPGYQREDFRSAARFLTAHATPADQVLVHLSWYHLIFEHYYSGPIAYPLGSAVQPSAELEARLPPLTTGEVLWLVQAGAGGVGPAGGDADYVVERWLSARFPLVTEVYPSGVMVKGFATRYRTAALPDAAQLREVRYPNGLTLRGYRLPEPALPRRDTWLHPPSAWVHLTLYWSVEQPLREAVHIAASLEDEAGEVWGGQLSRDGDLPAFYPPAQWQPGEVIRQDLDLNTNPGLAAGEYKVVLRVSEPASGTALMTPAGDDWLILDRVELR